MCVGAFMGQLDASVVTVALPTLENTLHVPLGAVEWVVLAYMLVLVAAIIPVARLADRHGRRSMYLAGFVVFTLGSAACAASPTLVVLVLSRVLQGAGAVLLQANSVALIRDAMPRERLGAAIGVQGAAQAVGLAAGPALGGALIALWSWRAIFLINLPAGVIGIAAAAALLPRDRARRVSREAIDIPGAVLFAAAAACLVGALSLPAIGGEPPGLAPGLGAAGIALLGLAALRQRSRPDAVVEGALLNRRPFLTGCAAALLAYAVLFGVLVIAPFQLGAAGGGALRAGLVLTVLPAALAVVAPVAGRISDQRGARVSSVGGMALATAGLGIMAAAPASLGAQVAALLLVGAGEGCFVPAMNASIMRAAAAEHTGAAAGTLNLVRGLGTALGVAAAAGALALSGIRQGLVLLAVLAVAAGVIAAVRTAARATAPAL